MGIASQRLGLREAALEATREATEIQSRLDVSSRVP
jgi:hypothetical protein